MQELEFLENKQLEERLIIEEKLTKSKKDIQNKTSGEEVVPKIREKNKNIN